MRLQEHRHDRVAEYGGIHSLCACQGCEARRVSAGREAEQPDLVGARRAHAADLCRHGVERLRVPHADRVAEHARRVPEGLEPLGHGLRLVGCMPGVAAAGQHDEVGRHPSSLFRKTGSLGRNGSA